METNGLTACRLFTCAALVLASAACAPTHVQTTSAPPMAVSQSAPELIIVRDFSVSPDSVKLDSGLGARLTNGSSSGTAQQMATGQKVVRQISETLVAELKKRGLPALREGQVMPTEGQPVLLVDGRMIKIDEGNRTRRAIIGFGAGRSTVTAQAELFYSQYSEAGSDPRLLSSFTGDAASARKPGAVGTMGAGAVADHLATSAVMTAGTTVASEALGSNVEADSQRLAKELAKKVADVIADHGWFPTTASR